MLISNGILMKKSYTLLNNKLFSAFVFIDIVKLGPELSDFDCCLTPIIDRPWCSCQVTKNKKVKSHSLLCPHKIKMRKTPHKS